MHYSKTYSRPALTKPKTKPWQNLRRDRIWRLQPIRVEELGKYLLLSTDSITKYQTKLIQVKGDQPVTEMPPKTRINTLQRKITELRIFTTYYSKYPVLNQKLLDKLKSGKMWSRTKKNSSQYQPVWSGLDVGLSRQRFSISYDK